MSLEELTEQCRPFWETYQQSDKNQENLRTLAKNVGVSPGLMKFEPPKSLDDLVEKKRVGDNELTVGAHTRAKNPDRVGAGKQAPGEQTCGVFSLITVLGWLIEEHSLHGDYGQLKIDVEASETQFSRLGIKNKWDKLIVEEGVQIPDLVSKMSDLMSRGQYELRTETGGLVKVEFDICVVFDDDMDFWDYWEQKGTPPTVSGRKTEYRLVNDLILAARGPSLSHALAVRLSRRQKHRPDSMIFFTENSWGEEKRYPRIPGDDWKTIVAIYRVHITRFHWRASKRDDWTQRYENLDNPNHGAMVGEHPMIADGLQHVLWTQPD